MLTGGTASQKESHVLGRPMSAWQREANPKLADYQYSSLRQFPPFFSMKIYARAMDNSRASK